MQRTYSTTSNTWLQLRQHNNNKVLPVLLALLHLRHLAKTLHLLRLPDHLEVVAITT